MTGERPHPRAREARHSVREAVIAIALSAAVVVGITVGGSGDAARPAVLTNATAVSAPSISATTIATAVSSPAVTAATPPEPDTVPTSTVATTPARETAPVSIAPAPVSAPVSTVPVSTDIATGTVAVTPDTSAATGLPTIDAKAFAVYDVSSKTWLASSKADTPLPVGSVMKLLTSYVVLQAGDLAKVVTVPALQVDVSESSIGLYKGERLPRDVLFRAMLIVSANDAARALAVDVGGSTDAFVAKMNAAAAQLGLSNTVAVNPIGLDAAGAHSSAHDVARLAALLMQDPTFSADVAKPSAQLHGQTFSSTNRLLTTYRGATGVKTGHTTDAGYCLVGSATRNGRSVIVVVLGASSDDQRLAGASALLDWAFTQR